jgi:hypothetical protein
MSGEGSWLPSPHTGNFDRLILAALVLQSQIHLDRFPSRDGDGRVLRIDGNAPLGPKSFFSSCAKLTDERRKKNAIKEIKNK